MRIAQLLGRTPCFSFEFFPPKDVAAEAALFRTIEDLAPLGPAFVSVTYGAAGASRARTTEIASRIKRALGIEAMAHLTCVGHARSELAEILRRFREAGVENVLCLRGDPPQAEAGFVCTEGGFRHASELIAFARDVGLDQCLGAAAYPEGHIEAVTRDDDLLRLKQKVDAGAEFVITQLFFDNAFYFDFVARAREVGIMVPIVPGLMPITSFSQVQRFTRMCGATLPMQLLLQLERAQSDPQAVASIGEAHATQQAVELLRRGAPGIHFYTLNKARSCRGVVEALRAEQSTSALRTDRAVSIAVS